MRRWSGVYGLESGLQLAGSLFEGNSDSRIVLISDGEENVATWRRPGGAEGPGHCG